MLNGFGFCASVDSMYRYIYNSNTDKAQKYDIVGNLIDENISIPTEVKVRLKPIHFIMMVDLMDICKLRIVGADGEVLNYTYKMSLFKTYEMLHMLLGMNIRFKTQRMVNVKGIDVASFLLCVSDNIDIVEILNKLPQKV